ncbi:MAG TPA: DUF2252 family protein [Caldimonas sp.]|nr:DUF2252 family protein [Caldimonas sp.]
MDAVHQILAFNAGRDLEALRIKYRTMRGGAFAFLRGTAPLFYERLRRRGVFRSAPLVWSCGDLHLENFGSYKADNRLVYFDINDFDDAALAPASWDLVRMLASVWVAADRIAVTAGEARRLCSAFLDAYAASLAAGKAYWMERETAQGLVRELLDGLRNRDRPRFIAGRTRIVGKRRVLRVDGKKALAASAAQRAAVLDFMSKFAPTRPDPRFFTVLDVARRVAGVGSLGLDRYAVLVRGKGSPDGNYLLDLKQSMPSALAPRLQVAQPQWQTEAHRVVAIQRRLQAVSIAFLHAVDVAGEAFVLRGLQPSEDRVTLDRSIQKAAELQQVVATMGRLVAWAQLRSSGREGSATTDELIDFGQRRKWKDKLLAASQDCAAQVRADSAAFDAAYDDGAFDV